MGKLKTEKLKEGLEDFVNDSNDHDGIDHSSNLSTSV